MSALKTITDAAQALRDGTTTSTELTTQCLERIAAAHELGAFVRIDADLALAAAATADEELRQGHIRSALHGIPLAIKDVFATKDAPTTANSRAIEPDWGAGVDANAVANLRAAGAVFLGKTTTYEFACGLPDETKPFPKPRNPWNVNHTADGSSSGSGIAVATAMALGAIGTDTGGSLRGPAAANGITGLKPTYGLVSREGVVPLSESLDTVGTMARSAQDCALLLTVLTGTDSTSTRKSPSLRVGVARTGNFAPAGLDQHALDAVGLFVAVLADAGASVRAVEVPGADVAGDANLVVIAAEAYAHHRRKLRSQWFDYGVSARRFLVSGAFVSSADYLAAQRFRTSFRRDVAKLFDDIDVLVTPSSAAPAAPLGVAGGPQADICNFDAPWNLAGLPAAAVPCGVHPSGLPLSVQLVGRPRADYDVLAVAAIFQQRTDWHLRMPPLPVMPE